MIYSVVVAYNGSKWIDKCIDSLVNSTVSLNIIIVDNGSIDGTLEIIQQKFPEVDLIKARKNLGFGRANNIGIRKAYDAGAEHIFLLNQDAWVEPKTIEMLVEAANKFPKYGVISPVHLNGEGNALDYGFINYMCRTKVKNYLSDLYLKSKDNLTEIYQLDFVNAAFWLLPRKTIEIVGGFNPFFFQYGEDRDYVNRCHYFDLKVGFVPLARACHDRVQRDSETKKSNLPRTLTLVKLFNPQNDVTIDTHIRALVKSLVKNLLCFQFRRVKYFVVELRYYLSNRKTIIAISQGLKSAGLTFLN